MLLTQLSRPTLQVQRTMNLTLITLKPSAVSVAIDDESGQGLVEYALILAFIAVVAITAAVFLGSDLSQAFSSIANHL